MDRSRLPRLPLVVLAIAVIALGCLLGCGGTEVAVPMPTLTLRPTFTPPPRTATPQPLTPTATPQPPTPTATPQPPTPLAREMDWRQRATETMARGQHAMAYDSARGVTVLFGGSDSSGALDDTWEWDGSNWSLRLPVNRPPAGACAMVYDSARAVIVLFGGDDGSGRGQTWEWHGTEWIQRSSADSPPSGGLAMAYDSARGVAVLFGGDDGSGRGQTWEWDGMNWTQRSAPNQPPARGSHALAYDGARGVTVLFGGYVGNTGAVNDTWEWDGTDWIELSPATLPSVRGGHALAYDGARGVTVLTGGHRIDEFAMSDETWEWDGADWTLRSPANRPGARTFHAMAYDSTRGVTVLFAGLDFPAIGQGAETGDTWEWDGTDWTDRTPVNHPPEREGQAMAYNSARGVTVLFGGQARDPLADTWEWDASEWTLRSPLQVPAARVAHAMAYDGVRGVVVLFGGATDAGSDPVLFDDTWEWDETDWVQRASANRPAGRAYHAMAYDSGRGVTVLFGGVYAFGEDLVLLDDTWEWDGTDWTQRSPAHRPPARGAHAMAYDRARGATILFGGFDTSESVLGDTWEWDGTDWIQRSPVSTPPARGLHALAYDSGRGVTILFGGEGGGDLLDGIWEWDGAEWARRSPENMPPARGFYAMAYDSAHGATVLFGGSSGDTWEYSALLPRPILVSIENPDGDGNYWLAWSTVPGATGYTLVEDDNPSFSSPVALCQGDQDEFLVLQRGPGDWYYRVRASDEEGESDWSNVEATNVRP